LIVFDDQLDLLAGDGIAVLSNMELGGIGDFTSNADMPVIGMTIPILTVSWAAALRALIPITASARSPVTAILLRMALPR